ncbi:MAG: acyl transferase [Bacteroidota bacterium]|nr:acyl transferase [Bacteroidota bacterium]
MFQLQYNHNITYKTYVDTIGVIPGLVNRLEKIPFLPIQFFKNKIIKTGEFEPEIIFESSGTTGANTSRHFVKDLSIYKKSFSLGFNLFYGNPKEWCIVGLLPGYLERQNSSLVAMVNELTIESGNERSGFYLHNHESLYDVLLQNELNQQQTLLIGVTFALLDFCENYSMQLHYTTVMETGGMKGRREEMTREEIHARLWNKLGTHPIHSEYGMTELLSQAYSKEKGLFNCPPWMKIVMRDETDPLNVIIQAEKTRPTSGLLNVIDLANLYSCSFIATDDVGKLYEKGNFEVLGRRDTSDLRGCSLLTALK